MLASKRFHNHDVNWLQNSVTRSRPLTKMEMDTLRQRNSLLFSDHWDSIQQSTNYALSSMKLILTVSNEVFKNKSKTRQYTYVNKNVDRLATSLTDCRAGCLTDQPTDDESLLQIRQLEKIRQANNVFGNMIRAPLGFKSESFEHYFKSFSFKKFTLFDWISFLRT